MALRKKLIAIFQEKSLEFSGPSLDTLRRIANVRRSCIASSRGSAFVVQQHFHVHPNFRPIIVLGGWRRGDPYGFRAEQTWRRCDTRKHQPFVGVRECFMRKRRQPFAHSRVVENVDVIRVVDISLGNSSVRSPSQYFKLAG